VWVKWVERNTLVMVGHEFSLALASAVSDLAHDETWLHALTNIFYGATA
jgi:hypothetical protein